MRHDTAINSGPQQNPTSCKGELVHLGGFFRSDVDWDIYCCKECKKAVQTVEGKPHWWNHTRDLSPFEKEEAKKQGVEM